MENQELLSKAKEVLELIKKMDHNSQVAVVSIAQKVLEVNPAKVTYQPNPDHQPETENITRQANYKMDEQVEPGSVYIASMPKVKK